MSPELTIWTVGHSTRSLSEFLEMLAANRIEALADVRQYPASRRYPHFNQRELSQSLIEAGIEYISVKELGGRRKPRPDSHNTAWRNESFRGYADYMETAEFRAGIERLLAVARLKRTAILCSEAVWWRCHRSLISDYLKAAGLAVEHILDMNKNEPHPYTSAARIKEGKLSYAE
jgi:uncharacterized protein (DUF488 family)